MGDIALASVWFGKEHMNMLLTADRSLPGRIDYKPPQAMVDFLSKHAMFKIFRDLTNGGTALHCSSMTGNYESMACLLQNGCDESVLSLEGYNYKEAPVVVDKYTNRSSAHA